MNIKLTAKASAELVLSSINRSLRKSSPPLPINADQYWNHDIQRALSLGLIEIDGEIPPTINESVEIIQIQSLVDRSLILPSVPGVIMPGKTVPVTRRTFNNLDIQQALALKIIGIYHEDLVKPNVDVLLSQLEGGPTPVETAKANESHDKVEELPTNDVTVHVLPPETEEDIDIEMLDDAEQFKLNGQAKVVERAELPKDTTYVAFDPRPAEPAAKGKGKGGKKGIKAVGRVKTAGADQETDDGIELEMITPAATTKSE